MEKNVMLRTSSVEMLHQLQELCQCDELNHVVQVNPDLCAQEFQELTCLRFLKL